MKVALFTFILAALSNIGVMAVPPPEPIDTTAQSSRELAIRKPGELDKRICGPFCFGVIVAFVVVEVAVQLIAQKIASQPGEPYTGDIYTIENPNNLPVGVMAQAFATKAAGDLEPMTGKDLGVVVTPKDSIVERHTEHLYWFGAVIPDSDGTLFNFEVFIAEDGTIVIDSTGQARAAGHVEAELIGDGSRQNVFLGSWAHN
ncbi:hypothetical protein C8J57DRAFT_1241922 [Mycena rebaudengoi]|nr:hypothetical protein C8J57DRAFT_1241922 [Mycena rebaudengoi]